MLRTPKAIILLVAACLTLRTAATADPSDTLIVGMELSYPPFEMADFQGQPAGVSVDLANALGAYLNKKIVIENIAFDGLIPSLKTGKIDLIISSMTETPERAQSIDFSDPYLKTGLCLLVGKNSGIQSIAGADMPGKTIIVKRGTTGQIYARDHIKNAHVLVLDRAAMCVLDVAQGRADALLYDQISVFKGWQKNQDTTRAILKPFEPGYLAIGIRKGNDPLRQQVNAFLASFKTSGGFDKLGDKWLKDQKDAFKQLGIPFYF
jgi:polar amino acid transport system substrate-binding protein